MSNPTRRLDVDTHALRTAANEIVTDRTMFTRCSAVAYLYDCFDAFEQQGQTDGAAEAALMLIDGLMPKGEDASWLVGQLRTVINT
jgi:hypothetical protein